MRKFNGGLCAILAVFFAALLANASPLTGADGGSQRLLGAKKCSWGPSYWCSNLTNAKGCNAVRHCIQTVWEKQSVLEDNDSICQICKDMVAQARDQLRSNQTMEELKEVFDGSCNLIPLKVIKKECCKLADDFIPELVEALSSQMNPNQVCSVAGLCNNLQIDSLLNSYYSGALNGNLKEEPSTDAPNNPVDLTNAARDVATAKQLSCGNCNSIATLIADKFQRASRDDILENALHLCGQTSSFSDACSNIVLTYFNDIYDHLKQYLRADGICHLSGVCASRYHQHPGDASTKIAHATTVKLTEGDDIPCEFCQQLVRHLRDLLVANTTEAEFKQVLEGFCKQTKGFRDECISIVDQYYDQIYNMLVNNLDANGACFMIGICPKTSTTQSAMFEAEIMPLLPTFPPAKIEITIRKKLGTHEPKFTQAELGAMQLPIDHLMGAPNPGLLVEHGQLCTLCEYLLHFIQESLATKATDDEIKRTVESVCQKLPNSVRGQCQNFVETYGDAVIALLVQGLDPRFVCPKLQMCPASQSDHDDVEVIKPEPAVKIESDKPTCPLCLFAVTQVQEKIRNDKSKKNIKKVLDELCVHLPHKLQGECVDFVDTYSSELIDLLITDFTAQEICVAIKLCAKQNSYLSELGISSEEKDGSSEEIRNELDDHDLPVEIVFKQLESAAAPNCWLCEELVKNAEKRINKNMSKEAIVMSLGHACDKLPKNVQKKCHSYVDKYGDKIADLILMEMAPKMICRELGLCLWSEQEDLEIDEALKYDVVAKPNEKFTATGHSAAVASPSVANDISDTPMCVICEFVMVKLENELKNKSTQEEIKHTIETICRVMPKTVVHACDQFVEKYSDLIISLIGSVPPKEICANMMLCMSNSLSAVNDEVIECGVCHGATMSLLPFLKQRTDHYALTQHDLVSVGCENLPAKYYDVCTEMINIYGKSILHLSKRSDADQAHICSEIGKCFDNESSRLAFVRISV